MAGFVGRLQVTSCMEVFEGSYRLTKWQLFCCRLHVTSCIGAFKDSYRLTIWRLLLQVAGYREHRS